MLRWSWHADLGRLNGLTEFQISDRGTVLAPEIAIVIRWFSPTCVCSDVLLTTWDSCWWGAARKFRYRYNVLARIHPWFKSMGHMWVTWVLSTRSHPIPNVPQFKQILTEECTLLPEQLLGNLMLSIEKRCPATIAVMELYIFYWHLSVVLHLLQTIFCADVTFFIKLYFCLFPYCVHFIPFCTSMHYSNFDYKYRLCIFNVMSPR